MNIPLVQKKVVAMSSATLVVLLIAAFSIATRSPQLTLAVAGALLLAAGFIVMAPCQLQMAAKLTLVIDNMTKQKAQKTSPTTVRVAAVHFALGYLTFSLPIALILGLTAWLFGHYAWILVIIGGLRALVLGLSTLGIVRHTLLPQRHFPPWLVRTKHGSFQRPFAAGLTFGQCCASCCGPYVCALTVLASATATFWLGSGLVMLYAITMVIPFLLPVLLAPTAYTKVSDRLQRLTPQISQATGYTLVGLGILLIPIAALLAAR